MSRPADPRILVSRRADGLLVGWLAVIVWIVVFAAGHGGVHIGANAIAVIYWTGAVITAAHFGLSYHLAYRRGSAALRERPVALVLGPLGLVAVIGTVVVASLLSGSAATARATTAMITAVYLMTTWHYVKQVYGVGRVGAAFAHVRLGPAEVHVLRYGLYPLWFLGAAQVLARNANYTLAGYRVGYDLLDPIVLDALRVVALSCAVPTAVVLVRIARRCGGRPPSLLVAPYVAAFLWLGLAPNPAVTTLVLAPFHALQYLAVGHRAEVAIAEPAPDTPGPAWWLNIFAGAACGGLLFGRWLPQTLDAQIHHRGGLLFAAAFFVFLNLHHYLIDASIWRSKGELVKAIVAPPAAPAAHLART